MSTGSEDKLEGGAVPVDGAECGSNPGPDRAVIFSKGSKAKTSALVDLSARARTAAQGQTLEKDLLSEALRQHYQSILDEPLPDCLLDLLETLPDSSKQTLTK